MPRSPFENLHNKIDSWMATPEKNISTHLEHDKKKGSYVNYALSCVLALLIYLIRWLLIDPAFRNFWLAKWLYYLPDRVYIAFCALNLHTQVLSITAIIIILAIAWTLNHNLQTEKSSLDQANAYTEKKAQEEKAQQLRLEKERKQAQIDTLEKNIKEIEIKEEKRQMLSEQKQMAKAESHQLLLVINTLLQKLDEAPRNAEELIEKESCNRIFEYCLKKIHHKASDRIQELTNQINKNKNGITHTNNNDESISHSSSCTDLEDGTPNNSPITVPSSSSINSDRQKSDTIDALKEGLPQHFTLPIYKNNTINYRETARILSLYLDITSNLETLNLYPENPPHTARNSLPRYFDQVSSNAFFCNTQNLTLLNYARMVEEIRK